MARQYVHPPVDGHIGIYSLPDVCKETCDGFTGVGVYKLFFEIHRHTWLSLGDVVSDKLSLDIYKELADLLARQVNPSHSMGRSLLRDSRRRTRLHR